MKLSELFGFESIQLCSTPFTYTCIKDWSWRVESMQDFDVWIVLSGTGVLRLGNDVHLLQPGSSFIFQPGDRVEAEQNEEDRMTVFYCHVELLDRRSQRVCADRLSWSIYNSVVSDLQVLRGYVRSISRASVVTPMQSDAVFAMVQLIAFLIENNRRMPMPIEDERLHRVAEAVEQDPSHHWSLDEMASVAGLSKNHFGRCFGERFNRTPTQFLIDERMNRARFLLAESPLLISQIAESLGYNNVYYFSRQFRNENGVSPKQWRGAVVKTD